MKKIISYSLYGNKDKYCFGIIESVDIIKKKYNDWDIYIFYSNDVPSRIINKLREYGCVLHECSSEGYKWEGMFWRFYPLDSDDIDIVISRDCDSRITEREMNLVNQWINSDKCFHIIRDHPAHGIEILGGTWGAKVKKFQELSKNHDLKPIDFYKKKFYELYPRDQERQPDQIFLKDYIFPIIKDSNLTHISFEELRYLDTDILIKWDSDFIGRDVDPKNKF